MTEYKDEKEFLNKYDSSKFENLAVTTDLLIFAISDLNTGNYRKLNQKKMSVYLVKREQFPNKDKLSLPGGFVEANASLDDSALKVLKQKTKLDEIYLEQLYTFGDVNRDPRMRIISVAYMALINKQGLSLDNDENWFTIINDNNEIYLENEHNSNNRISINELAFDHKTIIEAGLDRLKNKIEYTDLAFHLLPKEFTLSELQAVYETILGKSLLAPAFRRIIKQKVEKTGNIKQGSGHRPSAFYKLIS